MKEMQDFCQYNSIVKRLFVGQLHQSLKIGAPGMMADDFPGRGGEGIGVDLQQVSLPGLLVKAEGDAPHPAGCHHVVGEGVAKKVCVDAVVDVAVNCMPCIPRFRPSVPKFMKGGNSLFRFGLNRKAN